MIYRAVLLLNNYKMIWFINSTYIAICTKLMMQPAQKYIWMHILWWKIQIDDFKRIFREKKRSGTLFGPFTGGVGCECQRNLSNEKRIGIIFGPFRQPIWDPTRSFMRGESGNHIRSLSATNMSPNEIFHARRESELYLVPYGNQYTFHRGLLCEEKRKHIRSLSVTNMSPNEIFHVRRE